MKAAGSLLYLFFVALVFAIAANLEVASFLGAHPRWADTVVYIGMALALIPAVAVRLWAPRNPVVVLASLAALIVAAAATASGKRRFVASFADDTLAGSTWYFGWIAIVAALFLLFAALGRPGGR